MPRHEPKTLPFESPWKRFIRRWCEVGTAVIAFLAVLFPLGQNWWLIELGIHFQAYYAIAAFIAALVFWCLRRKVWAIGAAVLAIWFGWPALRYYFPSPGMEQAPKGGAASYKLISFNLLYRNTDNAAKIRDALIKESPDFLLLIEATPQWGVLLEELAQKYPHQQRNLEEGAFGNWLLSKYPFTTTPLGAERPHQAVIPATIQVEGKKLRLLGVHPVPPTGSSSSDSQKHDTALYPSLLNADACHAYILAGDLNSTPFSPIFKNLLDSTGLRDSAVGFGYKNTWYPLKIAPFGLPIDHIFVSNRILVHERSVGPALGSDHRWVKLVFSFKPKE